MLKTKNQPFKNNSCKSKAYVKYRSKQFKKIKMLLITLVKEVIFILSFLLVLWAFISFIDINSHNLTPGYKYSKYNLFQIYSSYYKNSMSVQEETDYEIDVINTDVSYTLQEESESYTEHDVDMLARLIYGEAGSNSCSRYMQLYVGSVVLNRVKSELFPDTLEEVIFQQEPVLQYACILEHGNYWDVPTDRCYEVARFLLENGSVLPENVLYQANFKQGDGVYCKEQNMYFCYLDMEE